MTAGPVSGHAARQAARPRPRQESPDLKLHSIQSLRAIAALLVVVFHLQAIELQTVAENGLVEATLGPLLAGGGYAGVDVFFVISGFIMVYVTGIVQPSPATSASFLFARLARIYPLWWLFAGLAVAYFYLTYGTPWDAVDMAASSPIVQERPWQHVIHSVLLLPYDVLPVLSVGWTLVHEMHFYLVFAVLLLFPRRWLPVLLALWAGLVTAGAAAGFSAPMAGNYTELFFHPLSLEFIAGCYAAQLVTSGRRWRPGLLALCGALAFAVALVALPDPDASILLWGRVVGFGLPAAVLVYGLAALEAEERDRSPRVLLAIGDWSYSLYLCHLFVLLALRRVMQAGASATEGSALEPWLRLGAPGLQDNLLFWAAGLVLSVAFAWLSFRLVEQPLLALMRRLRRSLFGGTRATLRPAPIRAAIW